MFVGPDGRWLGSYVPAWYRGYPFRLLQQEGADEMVLCIDESGKLIVDSKDPGEEFFAADGSPSPAVKPILNAHPHGKRAAFGASMTRIVGSGAGVSADGLFGLPGLQGDRPGQARAGALGTDHLVYVVTNATGEVASYDVTINIKEAPAQVKPSGGSKI
ncbi:MAG: SapC family protein [Candidatus Acidiferrales bacterium]|jgi:hypothetical protein